MHSCVKKKIDLQKCGSEESFVPIFYLFYLFTTLLTHSGLYRSAGFVRVVSYELEQFYVEQERQYI